MKYCPKCMKDLPDDDFNYKNKSKGVRCSYCKECTKIAVNNIRHTNKQKAIEYKGGRCVVCGYDRCPEALEFHHLDPTEKEFNFGKKNRAKFETLKSELDKCILVCSNCHKEIHSGYTEYVL